MTQQPQDTQAAVGWQVAENQRPRRRTYTRPILVKWGTLTELTAGDASGYPKDADYGGSATFGPPFIPS